MARSKPTTATTATANPVSTAATTVTDQGAAQGHGREKTLAAVTHALGLATLFVGPLVLYLAFRRKASPWLRAHLDEAVNYHILLVAAFILVVVGLVFLSQVDWAVTTLAVLLLLLVAAHVVFGVAAIVWAARGKSFHYPLDVRLVR